MKASADLEQARQPSAYPPLSGSGIRDAGQYFQQCALAGPVRPDDSDDVALLNLEIDFSEGPKRALILRFGATAESLPGRLRAARQELAKSLTRRRASTQRVLLRNVSCFNDGRHSDDVC